MKKHAASSAKIETNTTRDSVCNINVEAIKFVQLWDNYVTGNPVNDPLYENQCAIRLSLTFHKVGIKMKSFSQQTVKAMPGSAPLGRILHGGYPVSVRAYELGEWLKLMPFCGLPQQPENITGQEWEGKIKGRTGIIMFHAYWARERESKSEASGGHIDLWNGSRLTISGFADGFATIGRYVGIDSVRQGARIFPGLSYSDVARSKMILFWPMK